MSRSWLILPLAAALVAPIFAGEIIVAPPAGGTVSSHGSSDQREQARAYQKDSKPGTGTIIVLPDEENAGVLAPRTGTPEGRASDNRSRARQMQSGKDSPDIEIVVPVGGETPSTHDRARDLRSRADSYSRGESHANRSAKTNDGIPVIVCKDVESIAGRIGDDMTSGNVIVIVRDGKAMKVRCQ